ncbi:sialoadhesin-like [Pseudorasbora parva]|uniref:sialoadhesin-like n=1 Tax=Pseudorasbora parva TaxID=51549 RepID=UPI00351EAAB7
MEFRLVSLILLLHISGSLSRDSFSVSCEDVCALSETTVKLKCSYSNIKTVFWFSQKQSSNWRKNDEPEDLTLDLDYSGRVKQDNGSGHSTLIISDLRERDSGEYQLMFIMKDGVKRLSSDAVNLTVTVLQVRMSPASTGQRDQRVNLTCDTSCDLTSSPQNYYWKKNGQYIKDLHSRSISVPIEADVSYSCFLTKDLRNSSSPVCISNDHCWDVTYTSRRVCALMGSTVDISCTYTHPSGYSVKKTFWHYVQPGDFKDLREKDQFAGRVEYVGNTLRIKELKSSDSGEYQFRIITDRTEGKYYGSPGVILTVTDKQVISSPNIISERQEVILSCSTKCTLSDNQTYIWYKNGRQVTDGFTKDNKLYLDSVSNEELQEYSCAGADNRPNPNPNPNPNPTLKNTIIILSVFLLILALIGVLWYRKRRNNSSQQYEDTKDDVQSGSATLYENAAPLSTVYTQQDHTKNQDVYYSTIDFKNSPTTNTSLAPTVHSTSDDVPYSTVNFGRPSV